jgi:uncharacterized alpha/beta hydrolase family protein
MKRRIAHHFLPAVLIAAVLLNGCTFSKLEDDLEDLATVTHEYSGVVLAEELESDSIVVVAMADPDGDEVLGYWMAYGESEFTMRLPAGEIYFVAFNDLNKDLTFQEEEPLGWGSGGQAVVGAEEAVSGISIPVSRASRNDRATPASLVDKNLSEFIATGLSFAIGTVSSLDNPWFSEERAKSGLWQPFAFMAEGGAGIHFLQPYDPKKIPVLFVHGINGSPRNFETLIASLDTEIFQPWVYSYPSGLALANLSRGMARFMELLHIEHGFTELHVVAHSMGGLVSRGGINLCMQLDACNYLRTYTTISTPWNGVESAQSGVKWAPTVVPVWRDLDPTSDYVTTLFDTRLRDGFPHRLLFGFRQDSIFGSESSDGVIKLSSQLRHDAQLQASLVRGYDESHVSILSNADVIKLVNEILATSTTASVD